MNKLLATEIRTILTYLDDADRWTNMIRGAQLGQGLRCNWISADIQEVRKILLRAAISDVQTETIEREVF